MVNLKNYDGRGPLFMTAGQGHLTFPLSTPGDLKRLRFGAHYRARDARDSWDFQVSLDGGKTFIPVDRVTGPTSGHCRDVSFDKIPAGTRSALVRFAGHQVNTTGILDFRIDADYQEPHGGFAPIRITYQWEESGQAKSHTHVARSPQATYELRCAGTPKMTAIILERAD